MGILSQAHIAFGRIHFLTAVELMTACYLYQKNLSDLRKSLSPLLKSPLDYIRPMRDSLSFDKLKIKLNRDLITSTKCLSLLS
jgi:hypothetical protein